MKDSIMEKIISSIYAYIIFFALGSSIFIGITHKVMIPVYQTCEGKISIDKDKTYIELEGKICGDADNIYYYAERNQWVKKAKMCESNLLEIQHDKDLQDGQTINVDIQCDSISLFNAIFIKAGNI